MKTCPSTPRNKDRFLGPGVGTLAQGHSSVLELSELGHQPRFFSKDLSHPQHPQGERFVLTCGYTRPTLWHMAKSKKKVTAKPLKDAMVRFRVSTEQKQAFEEAAKRDGLEVSAWIRRLALKEAGVLLEAK
jgi:hypothetical protein